MASSGSNRLQVFYYCSSVSSFYIQRRWSFILFISPPEENETKIRILKRHYLLKNESDWLFYPQSPQINEFVICVLGRPIIFEKSLFCHLTGHIKKSQIISKNWWKQKRHSFFFFVSFNNVKLPLVDSFCRHEFDSDLWGVLGWSSSLFWVLYEQQGRVSRS